MWTSVYSRVYTSVYVRPGASAMASEQPATGMAVIPYLVAAALYLAVAVLAALDASLVNLEVLEWFSGLRWLRIHLITIGAITQAVFGVLGIFAAKRAGRPRRTRWDIWLLLNTGMVVLLVGIPLVESTLILVGGTLVFAAATLLGIDLVRSRPASSDRASVSWAFYVTGLAFLLLGVTVGTGLFIGWNEPLALTVPVEVHIHAQSWGFMSLVFAGLVVDLYPQFAGRPLAWPDSTRRIHWLMTIGATLLVLGPWLGSNWFSVPGVVLHLTATGWVVANIVVPLRGDRMAWTPGMLHIVTSYAWILAPVLVAPLIIAGVSDFPGAGIEANAPQALIYGWVLAFGAALVPWLLRRSFVPGQPARLGGNWVSLTALHLGSVALWIGIFATDLEAVLHGLAYALWAVALVSIVRELFHIIRTGVEQGDPRSQDPLGTAARQRQPWTSPPEAPPAGVQP